MNNNYFLENIFKPILNTYIEVTESLNGLILPPMELEHLQGITYKLFLQTNTALHLLNGTPTKIRNTEHSITDINSMQILARSMLETYAVFHHIFIEPQNDQVKDFRLCYSQYRGLRTRKNANPHTIEQAEQALRDDSLRLNLLQRLQNNQHYQYLQQLKFPNKPNKFAVAVEQGRFEETGKSQMLIEAGFSPKTAKLIYGFLSDHSHSGYLSLLQAADGPRFKDAKDRGFSVLGHFFHALSLVILDLATKYPQVQTILDNNPNIETVIQYFKRFNNILDYLGDD